jgi:crotonobetainyl-CoA:carnitine CoA-transferase CaiB-like acyl-CoA transferase
MRIVELSENKAAAFAGMLLADLGNEVIKVEHPGGDPSRFQPGRLGDDSTFVYLNRRKKSIEIDGSTRFGRRALKALALDSDGVVEDLGRGGLEALGLPYRSLKRARRESIVVSISPFGLDGPRSRWQASELVVQAMGGVVHNTGWDDSAPLRLAGDTAAFVAGINAATALLAAVYGIEAGTETGVHIDVSMQETFAQHWTRHIAQWCYAGTKTRRERREFGRQGFPHTVPASDGLLYILALREEWEALAFFLGLEEYITSDFTDPAVRAQRWPEIEPHFYESIASKSRYQWFAEAAARGYTFAPVDDPLAILASPQLAARGFFREGSVDGRALPVPGLPFEFETGPTAPNRASASGEHTMEIEKRGAADLTSASHE